tara:strand:- start:167 stop:1858 length:1692 start_codon:yes stop_codon:yes gene_type:complete
MTYAGIWDPNKPDTIGSRSLRRWITGLKEDYKAKDIGGDQWRGTTTALTDAYQKLPEDFRTGLREGGAATAQQLMKWNEDERKTNVSGMGPLDPLLAVGWTVDKAAGALSHVTGIHKGWTSLATDVVIDTATFGIGGKGAKAVKGGANVLRKAAQEGSGEAAYQLTRLAMQNMPEGSILKMVADTGGGVVPPPKVKPSRNLKYLDNVDTSAAGYNWIKQGGELDKALEDILRAKQTKGKYKKGDIRSYNDLTLDDKNVYDSLLATGPATSADDPLVYGKRFGVPNELARTESLKFHPNYSPQLDKSKEFHHYGMKSLQGPIHRRARALRNIGKATDEDLLNLHGLSNSYGTPSGSRRSAGLYMHRPPHHILHKKSMLPQGIQPDHMPEPIGKLRSRPKDTDPNLWKEAKKVDSNLTRYDLDYIEAWESTLGSKEAIKRWKAFKKTKAYKLNAPDGTSELQRMIKKIEKMTISELTEYQEEILETITKPMTEEALLYEAFSDTLSAGELLDIRKNKNWDELWEQTETWKRKQSDISDVKADERMRQMGGQAAYNPWFDRNKYAP